MLCYYCLLWVVVEVVILSDNLYLFIDPWIGESQWENSTLSVFVFLSENNRLHPTQSAQVATATTTTAGAPVITGSLVQQQQHHTPRTISGTPPGSLVNSPKATKLRNGLVHNSPHAAANRLRSKESSPELSNGTGGGGHAQTVSLEKRILDAIVLLNQNKYSVCDDGQQKEVGAKLARFAEMETELQVQSKGVKALGVLVNYLVHDVSIICIYKLIGYRAINEGLNWKRGSRGRLGTCVFG